MLEPIHFDQPKIEETREKVESEFLKFKGYEAVTQEARDGLVQTIMGSVDEEVIRKAEVDSIIPPYLKELTDDDVRIWVSTDFIKDKYQPIYEDRIKILEKKAQQGDKTAILLLSMFGEDGNLHHWSIVDRWARIEEIAELRLVYWKQDIRGEHGTVTSDDWNEEMQKKVSEMVGAVNEEVQGIREQLDNVDSSLKQEFESYVQSLREKRQAGREQYLASRNHNVDERVKYKLQKIEQDIRSDVDRLAEWQKAISDFWRAKEGRFGPKAITIPNKRQMESMGSTRGFSGQVNVDQRTGDLTLDLGQNGKIFAIPPEFSGIKPDGLKARMEFKAKEVHADGQEEEYVISLGFDDKYGSKPYLQFVCTETDQVSDKIYFGPDTRLDMMMVVRKPVIYLYSDKSINAEVQVNYKGRFTTVYPDFTGNNKWVVKTLENGLLECQNKTYPYLFWEGIPYSSFDSDFDEGFCIKRDDLKEFLEDKLTILGLNPKEQTDFITYWLPVLERNEFSLIQFCAEEYENKAKLLVQPNPDQLIRVFMKLMATDRYVHIKGQKLTKVERRDDGFIVVEWGGVDLGRD